MAANDEQINLILNVETSAADRAVLNVERLEKAVEGLKKSGADMGRTMLESGRIIQDFAQGGIGGILNNVEGAARAMGGGAGLAGVLTALGVAAFLAKPYLTELFNAISGAGSNDVPQLTDKIAQLNKELETNKKRLEELGKQQSLTNKELVEYKGLVEDTTQKEAQLEMERERAAKRKADAAALAKAAGAPEAEAAKARAENLQAAFGGGTRGLEVDLFRNMGPQSAAAQDQLLDEINRLPPGPERDNLLRQLTMIRRATTGPDRFKRTQELEASAIGGGDLNAINALRRLLPKGSEFRGAFGDVQPDAMAAQDREVAEAEAFGARARAGGEGRRRNARELNERRKRVEERQKKEDASIRQAADEEDHEKAKADRALKQAPSAINAARRTLQAGRDLMQRQAVEREINQRSGGQNSYKDVQEAAKRTLDLTARGVHINDALITAMQEQGQKIRELNNHITGQDVAIKQMRQMMRHHNPVGMRRAFPQ